MSTVAVVLVTHNAQQWIEPTLASIAAQTRQPDAVIVIDDHSTDATLEILRAHGLTPIAATATDDDITTRIAQNFVQGVRACGDATLIALGDHDDIWHADRLARQCALLDAAPDALMVASDGIVIDAAGAATGASLRTAFPVPDEWASMPDVDRLRYALRHSVATGGASMIRPAAFPDLTVPAGWLHDRWWSLVATARGGLLLDADAVIDYRVQGGQQVGLDRAAQGLGPVARVLHRTRDTGHSWRKYRDLRTQLRPLAAKPEVAATVRLGNLI